MPGLFQDVQAAFRAKQWAFEEVPGQEVLQSSFEAHHTRVVVHVQAFEPIHALHVVSTSPYPFQSHHRLKLSELLMRTSQELTVGNFEMRWDERHVLFRAPNLFDPAAPLPPRIVHALVHTAVAEMDRMTPLLAEIHQSDAAQILTLDVPRLMRREDWLPPVSIVDDDA